jgi:hypothetical protein
MEPETANGGADVDAVELNYGRCGLSRSAAFGARG